jgi:hypothetical protein
MEKNPAHIEFVHYLQSFARDNELCFFRACEIDIHTFVEKMPQYQKNVPHSTQDMIRIPNFAIPWLFAYECSIFADVYDGMLDATKRSLRATVLIKEFEQWFEKLKPHSPLCILVFMYLTCMSYHRCLRRDVLSCSSEKEYVACISEQFSKFTHEAEEKYCNNCCSQVYCVKKVPPSIGRNLFSPEGLATLVQRVERK